MRRTLIILALAAGCDDKAAPPYGVPDGGLVATPIARGDYLVNHVAACGSCHTPRLADGTPDVARALAGVECFVDVAPGDATVGCIHTRNLTNHETGLKNRTDQQIKDMFQKGMRPGGTFLHPFMPYSIFANMTAADADAVVAYLRTVPGVDHTIPAQQPPWNDVAAPAPPLAPASIPAAPAGNASAGNGRYLAAMAGLCVECHTPDAAMGGLDMTKAFSGGKDFQPGFPSPPFPAHIYSRNLTPAASGLMGWTAADVVKVLREGKDRMGHGVCPPMPAGPFDAYGGLTAGDATDIANYLLSLPPIVNQIANDCQAPGT